MKIYICIYLEDEPNEQPYVKVETNTNYEDACSHLLKSYWAKKEKLEKEGFKVLTEGDYASFAEGDSACLNYETSEGIATIQWSLQEEEVESVVEVKTGIGTLIASEPEDASHKGISVDLKVYNSHIPLAMIEYFTDDSIPEPTIRTRVWGNENRYKWTDEIIHVIDDIEKDH